LHLQEVRPSKEPQAFEEIKMNEVILSVAICHPRKVCKLFYNIIQSRYTVTTNALMIHMHLCLSVPYIDLK